MHKLFTVWLITLWTPSVFGALQALADDEMGAVSAGAIGIVLSDIQIIGDNSSYLFLDPAADNGSTLKLDNLYLIADAGDNSQTGAGNGNNIGSVAMPIMLGVQTLTDNLANTRTSLALVWPEGVSGSGFELGTLATFSTPADGITGGADDTFWVKARGGKFDGSWLHLWGENGEGLVGSIQLNIQADWLGYSLKSSGSEGDFGTQNVSSEISNLDINLRLGTPFYQPMKIYSTDTTASPNYAIEISAITPTTANQFYTEPTGHILYDNARLGTWSLGANRIQGVQIHYLDIQTRDFGSAIN